jgi:hypothetical protein
VIIHELETHTPILDEGNTVTGPVKTIDMESRNEESREKDKRGRGEVERQKKREYERTLKCVIVY